jgi:hypothetical protein
VYNLTGMLTIPKLMTPFQIDLGMFYSPFAQTPVTAPAVRKASFHLIPRRTFPETRPFMLALSVLFLYSSLKPDERRWKGAR